MVAELIATELVAYALPGQRAAVRTCRTWEAENGSTVTIITELPGASGPGISNAAEAVREALEERWGTGCQIVEHHPVGDRDDYVEQFVEGGSLNWNALDPDEVRALLGPDLDSTNPAARPAATNGAV